MAGLRTDPVPLDHALERIAGSAVAAASRPQLTRFQAVRRRRDGDDLASPAASLVDEMFDFLMPQLSQPGLFQGSRYLSVLEELAGLLDEPSEATDEADRWAALVLRHELRKHRLLWQYRNSLVDG